MLQINLKIECLETSEKFQTDFHGTFINDWKKLHYSFCLQVFTQVKLIN